MEKWNEWQQTYKEWEERIGNIVLKKQYSAIWKWTL